MSEVFVVDDDPLARAALSIVLSGEGFWVTSFVDGESFLNAAHCRTPACVLIDVHLPGCSGLELLKALDARRYPAPIFIISGRADIPMAVDAIRNGALDFIEKPFDDQRMLDGAGHGQITTEIAKTGPFYYAEDYHQQYLAKNPGGYCGLGGTGVACPVGLISG